MTLPTKEIKRLPRKAKKEWKKQRAWIDADNRFAKWWNENKEIEINQQ